MAFKRFVMPIFFVFFLVACSAPSDTTKSEKTGSTDSAPHPDMILFGGPIYTGLDNQIVEAVAVTDGRITAVGNADDLLAQPDTKVKKLDLKGAALFPGFTDSHAHLVGIGLREMTVNLENVGSIKELVETIERITDDANENDTIYGAGWIETGWPEGRMPTRDDLDPVSANIPVILERADFHAALVNTAALEAAGITDETEDPDGGRIERDENGRATGLLIDNAFSLVAPLMAQPTDDQKRDTYIIGGEVYAAYGWSGIHNMSVDPGDVEIIETLSEGDRLGLRIYNALTQEGLAMLADRGHQTSDNGRVMTRAVKLYIDGALGSRGAALSAPYSDAPETSGLTLLEKEKAADLFGAAIRNDIQITTHAIGDRGNKIVLDWYEEVFQTAPSDNVRWRIEHAQILHTEDIPRFAQLGVIPSMQPSHAIGDLHFAPDRLGPNRLQGAYAWRSLIDSGAIIVGGSDAPVERGDPLIEFYAAVARKDLEGFQGPDWQPEQAVSRIEALKMFTLWPAIASFREDELGTIEIGKRADFTAFAKDIMTIPAEDIPSATPVLTVVDGAIIFSDLD